MGRLGSQDARSIDVTCWLMMAHIVVKGIVGNAVKPRGKAR